MRRILKNDKAFRRIGKIFSFSLTVAILLFGVFSFAKGNDFDDFIEALNRLVMQEGPFPGQISDERDANQLNAEMALVGQDLSSGRTNTDDPHFAAQFAFESNHPNSTEEIAGETLNQDNLQGNGKIDIPTGAKPSFLYGAEPFSQKMLRFEEFGSGSIVDGENPPSEGPSLPMPEYGEDHPDEGALDDFLSHPQHINEEWKSVPYPAMTRWANDPDHPGDGFEQIHENPWKTRIEEYLARELTTPPAEGRPPGEDWAHQRWWEFYPTEFTVTAQAGARDNSGFRDRVQLHRYAVGEFGPGPDGISGTEDDGLYHVVSQSDTTGPFIGSTKGVEVRFHPNMPKQQKDALWAFDGTLPPKLMMGRYGEPILFRHYNALPIDPLVNRGFGTHTLSTHHHNGHNPAESDGYTQSFFFPGQYYDYHWPMILAGHDTINTDATDRRAGGPDGNGGIKTVRGDWQETMSTHWFHDHMLDFTAQNVYKGNAAMFNLYSALDRGNEAIDDGVNLRFPSGTALDWGNRDYDVNLLIKGIAWDDEGQLWFNIFNTDGFLGDQLVVNWLWQPYLDVKARRYRFRILNAAVSRYITSALVEEVEGDDGELPGPPGSGVSYNRVPFYMILNDGNIMEHAVYFDGNKTVAGYENRKGILPTQAIAERYDIVVDFKKFEPGTKLYLVNILEHRNGRRPHTEIPLGDVLSGEYKTEIRGGRNRTDPTVGKFLEFRVHEYDGVDLSMDPADYVEGKKTMVPLPEFTQEELDNAIHRTFEFGRSSGTDKSPWTIKTDGGAGYNMDPRRLSAAPNQGEDGTGQVEIWHFSTGGGWSHPIHVHFEEGQVLERDGKAPPEWEKWARKDVYRIGRMHDSSSEMSVAVRFREFLGSYMEHCHNTQHEDHAMLLRWDIEAPGQVRVMPSPMPSWDGVGYVPSYALETFRTGVTDMGGNGDSIEPPGADEPEAPGNTEPEEGGSSEEILASGQVDQHGRIRLSGQVEAGREIETNLAGVRCRLRSSGVYRCAGRDLEPGQTVSVRFKAAAAEPDPEPADGGGEPTVVATGHVDDRGRIRIEGQVDSHQRVVVDEAGVSCRIQDSGRFGCRGRDLDPGQAIVVRVVDVGSLEESGSFVAREQASERGRIRISGRVSAGSEVSADVEAVSCSTSSLGRFRCRGRVDPFQWVAILKN